MPKSETEMIALSITISTALILFLGVIVVRYVLLYQRKRYRHQQEKLELKKEFDDNLMESKFEIQEQTLNYISEQIHDHFSPGLWSVKTMIRTVKPDNPEQVREKIDETVAQVQELYNQMRAMSLSLNTEQLMRMGFRQSLQNELNRLAKSGGYQTNLSVKGSEVFIEPGKAIILFRICQEALNNTQKHSDAKNIDIVIDYSEDPVILTISDDGNGFNAEETLNDPGKQDSTGLRNIHNRARLIGASVQVLSEPGKGTRTIVNISNLKEEPHAASPAEN
jgi:signal transduction histidine kinase